MTDTRSTWYLRSFSYHRVTKCAQIRGVYKGKCLCFRIFISPENFHNSSNSLEAYNNLIDRCDHIYDDKAEMDMQEWVVTPFLPVFDQIESVDMRQGFTLQDYLIPQAYTYRFELFVVNERKEPHFDYGVPEEPDVQGIVDTGYPKHSEWKRFRPEEVRICPCLDGDHCHERCLADFPTKVFVGGNFYFYKQTVDGDMTKALTEMRAYKRMQISGINNTTQEQEQEYVDNDHDDHGNHSKDSKEDDGDDTYENEHEQSHDQQHNQDDQGYDEAYVPRVHGLTTQDNILFGLLLSWIESGDTTLEYIYMHNKVPSVIRQKWDHQITSTLARLHEDWILRGDAKAGNALVDIDLNA